MDKFSIEERLKAATRKGMAQPFIYCAKLPNLSIIQHAFTHIYRPLQYLMKVLNVEPINIKAMSSHWQERDSHKGTCSCKEIFLT